MSAPFTQQKWSLTPDPGINHSACQPAAPTPPLTASCVPGSKLAPGVQSGVRYGHRPRRGPDR